MLGAGAGAGATALVTTHDPASSKIVKVNGMFDIFGPRLDEANGLRLGSLQQNYTPSRN